MRFLGIDYGDSHIGFAIGDDESHLALPLETITNHGFDLLTEDIKKLIDSEGIDALVVGVPMLGKTFEEQRLKIEKFISRLKDSVPMPIHASDESFSSRQAQRLIQDQSSVPGADEHAIAAMLILQSFFDKSSM